MVFVEMMEKLEKKMEDLEALPVDNAGACLVVLLLGDPHLLEGSLADRKHIFFGNIRTRAVEQNV